MGSRGPGARPVQSPNRGLFPEWAPDELPVPPNLPLPDTLIAWLEQLPVPAGMLAGQRMTVFPWQREIVRALYPDDRRVRQGVVSVPRKNGKTGLAAGLALAHLCGPLSETLGEVYSAAADRQQAAILHRVMVAIVDQVPALKARLSVKHWNKSIVDSTTGSIYQALSADAKTKHGMSATFVIADELAQWPHRELWDVLSTSGGARSFSLCLAISTQAPRSDHIMSELLDYGASVAAGAIVDPTFYSRCWSAPEDADPWSETVWRDCNPGLGTIRSLSELRSAATKAKVTRAQVPAFRNLYLNQRVAASAGFLTVTDWLDCEEEFDESDLAGQPCFVGIDMASVSDLAAMVAYFPSSGRVLSWAWVTEQAVDYAAARVPYRPWADEGFVTIAGRTINRRAIVRQLGALTGRYDVEQVVYDRWGMADFNALMEDEGIWVRDMEPFGQGFQSMSPALATLEGEILEQRLHHNGNPLLTWTFQNIVLDTDPAGNRKLTKSKARDKVDPMVALVMAVGAASRAPVTRYDFGECVVAV